MKVFKREDISQPVLNIRNAVSILAVLQAAIIFFIMQHGFKVSY